MDLPGSSVKQLEQLCGLCPALYKSNEIRPLFVPSCQPGRCCAVSLGHRSVSSSPVGTKCVLHLDGAWGMGDGVEARVERGKSCLCPR